jgi:hypothetical protein
MNLPGYGGKEVPECQLTRTGHKEWAQLIARAPRVHVGFVGVQLHRVP